MNIKPLANMVIVKSQEEEDGAIAIPEMYKRESMIGEVLDVGPGRYSSKEVRILPEVKKGDKVLHPKYSGRKFKHEGEEVIAFHESEIMAIIDED